MKYSHSLDSMIKAAALLQAGKPMLAATALAKAVAHKDFAATLAALDKQQTAAITPSHEAALAAALASLGKAKKSVKAEAEDLDSNGDQLDHEVSPADIEEIVADVGDIAEGEEDVQIETADEQDGDDDADDMQQQQQQAKVLARVAARQKRAQANLASLKKPAKK